MWRTWRTLSRRLPRHISRDIRSLSSLRSLSRLGSSLSSLRSLSRLGSSLSNSLGSSLSISKVSGIANAGIQHALPRGIGLQRPLSCSIAAIGLRRAQFNGIAGVPTRSGLNRIRTASAGVACCHRSAGGRCDRWDSRCTGEHGRDAENRAAAQRTRTLSSMANAGASATADGALVATAPLKHVAPAEAANDAKK